MNQAREFHDFDKFFIENLFPQVLKDFELPIYTLLSQDLIKSNQEIKSIFDKIGFNNNHTYQERFELMAMAINLLASDNELSLLEKVKYTHIMQENYEVLYKECFLNDTQKTQLNAIIGSIYFQLNNHQLAISYYKEAIVCKKNSLNTSQDKAELQHYSYFLIQAYLKLGENYGVNKSISIDAMNYYRESIKIANKALILLDPGRFTAKLYFAKAQAFAGYAFQQFRVSKYSREGLDNIFNSIISAMKSYNTFKVQYNKDMALRHIYATVKTFLIRIKYIYVDKEKYILLQDKLSFLSTVKYPLTNDESILLISTINNLNLENSTINNINSLKSPVFSSKEIVKDADMNKENIETYTPRTSVSEI
jgi:tetratricopeptide (TPR) repeat protein